jgi:hypothetical protein
MSIQAPSSVSMPPLPIHAFNNSEIYLTTNKLDFNKQTADSSHITYNNTNDSISAIYLYKNDPKQINKGLRISDVIHPQGGYMPVLAEVSYDQRKFTNTSHRYDNKLDHGSRPQHKSTFNIITHSTNTSSSNPPRDDMLTSNQVDYRGLKTRPEYIQYQGEDQFRPHFDVSEYSNQRSFNTSYSDQFYSKSTDHVIYIYDILEYRNIKNFAFNIF